MAERVLVGVHEAAEITGLAPSTIYKLARERRLRTFKVLGALRFAVADLQELIVERPATNGTGQ